MTAQLPLPMAPGVPIGSAVSLVEDVDGGRVFINGQLSFAWDAGDVGIRRLAAVQLARIKAARVFEVAAGFGVDEYTVYRWGQALTAGGPAGLTPERRGPKGPSKLTDAVIADIVARRAAGQSIAAVAAAVGVSARTVSTATAQARSGVGGGMPGAGRQASDSVAAESIPDAEPVSEEGVVAAVADAHGAGSDADRQTAEQIELFAAGPAGQAAGDATGAQVVPPAPVPVPPMPSSPQSVLPVLPERVDRSAERVAARSGLLPYAPPVFAPAARVPLAGLFLAVPALVATGLLDCAGQVYGAVPAGFYGLDTMLTEAVLRALLGEPRAEGATRVNPTDLGRVLGLDRAPEVKTVRRKTAVLADRGKAADLLTALARRHAADHPEAMNVLYVDGHVRTYHGTRKIQKTHVSRLRFPAPATVETWIVDAQGAPVWVVMAQPGASLAAEIRRLIPHIRGLVGDDRRVLVGFDRGGWSPALLKDLIDAGFDVLTWRKAPAPDVPAEKFTQHTHTDDLGRTRTLTLADTTVQIPLDDADPAAGTVQLRQVSKQDPGTDRQVHILTSRTDLSPAQVCFRMGARWRQENYFRYGRIRYALDSHDSYTVTDDDPDRSVPNPAKKTAYQQVQGARARLHRAETHRDEQFLALRSPKPGAPSVLTNQVHDAITAPARAARTELDAATAKHRATPTRLPLGQVRPGQQILDTETKLLTHAIRMTAFNTQTHLARTITTSTGFAKAGNEAHALVRAALHSTGDIDPTTPGVLHIHLDPQHTPRATAAIAELCTALNSTNTAYPGTDQQLHYSVKPHR